MALCDVPCLSQILVFWLILVAQARSLEFGFDGFPSDPPDRINLEGDASAYDNALHLTQNPHSSGHATFSDLIHLQDADWETTFDFIIEGSDEPHRDGLSFFLAPPDFRLPQSDSADGYLGLLFSDDSAFDASKNQVVAIEIDTYQNEWDPSSKHIGLNINSIKSVATVSLPHSGDLQFKGSVRIQYSSVSEELKVDLSADHDGTRIENFAGLTYVIDLSTLLPEDVQVGFSASTGSFNEAHVITSWKFNSSI